MAGSDFLSFLAFDHFDAERYLRRSWLIHMASAVERVICDLRLPYCACFGRDFFFSFADSDGEYLKLRRAKKTIFQSWCLPRAEDECEGAILLNLKSNSDL
jgi:hypothetical protein